MSCFAVSKLTGRCGGGSDPAYKDEDGDDEEDKIRALAVKMPPPAPASVTALPTTPSKKKSRNNMSNVEIFQEVLVSSSPSPCPGSPILLHTPRRSDSVHGANGGYYPPAPNIYPPVSSGHHCSSSFHPRSPSRTANTNQQHQISVPNSPLLGQGGRSPVLQRKTECLEAQNVAALGALKEEILEMSKRLSRVTKERDHLEKSLNRVQMDKIRLAKQKDDQMDSMSLRYEERLVELHSVIAELSRQVEDRCKESTPEDLAVQDQQLPEEDEEEEDEEQQQGRTNEQYAQTKSDLASRTSTDILDAEAVEAGHQLAGQFGVQVAGDLCTFLRMTRSTLSRSNFAGGGGCSSTNSLQVLALQEELSDAKERNLQLTARLQQREADLDEARRDLEQVAQERETLRLRVSELEEQHLLSPALSPTRLKMEDVQDEAELPLPQSFRLRMAEKRKIRRMHSHDASQNGEHHLHRPFPVTGSELTNVGVRMGVVAEHLVQEMQDKSSMNEFSQSLMSDCPTEGVMGPSRRRSAFLEAKLKEFEIEMERLSSRIEHLKSQNDLLTLTLAESKNHCDNITLLIGKYESNFIAQQLALSYADHIIESQDVLASLAQSEISLLLAQSKACAVHQNDSNEASNLSGEEEMDRLRETRRQAEIYLKQLLIKLEAFARPDSGIAMPSSSIANANGSNAGGITWEDSSGYSQATTSSASPSIGSMGGVVAVLSSSSHGSLTVLNNHTLANSHHSSNNDASAAVDLHLKAELAKVRDYIAYLKSSKVTILSTVLPDLESLHSVKASDQAKLMSISEARTADLEMAVLIQELMAMREEKADLRAQVYLLEQEKKSLELVIGSQKAQEMALKAHLQHLQDTFQNRVSESESECSFEAGDKHQKYRIAELMANLEKVKKNAELRQQQSDQMIKDLKAHLLNLNDKLTKTKKRHQQRIKKMEQQMLQSMLFPSQFGAMLAKEEPVLSKKLLELDEDPSEEELRQNDEQEAAKNDYLISVMLSSTVTSAAGETTASE